MLPGPAGRRGVPRSRAAGEARRWPISARGVRGAYLAGYRRHARRVMESVETAGAGPGRLRAALRSSCVNRRLLPHPLERATFHFISNTILRNAGIACFWRLTAESRSRWRCPAWCGSARTRRGHRWRSRPRGLAGRSADAFLLRRLRPARRLQSSRRNCAPTGSFRSARARSACAHIRAARKWIVLMGMAPLFALLAPFEICVPRLALALHPPDLRAGALAGAAEPAAGLVPQDPVHLFVLPGQDQHGGDGVFSTWPASSPTAWTMADLEADLIRAGPSSWPCSTLCGMLVLRGLARLEHRESERGRLADLRGPARPHRAHPGTGVTSLSLRTPPPVAIVREPRGTEPKSRNATSRYDPRLPK